MIIATHHSLEHHIVRQASATDEDGHRCQRVAGQGQGLAVLIKLQQPQGVQHITQHISTQSKEYTRKADARGWPNQRAGSKHGRARRAGFPKQVAPCSIWNGRRAFPVVLTTVTSTARSTWQPIATRHRRHDVRQGTTVTNVKKPAGLRTRGLPFLSRCTMSSALPWSEVTSQRALSESATASSSPAAARGVVIYV